MYKLGRIGALHHVAMAGSGKIVFKSLNKGRCLTWAAVNNQT